MKPELKKSLREGDTKTNVKSDVITERPKTTPPGQKEKIKLSENAIKELEPLITKIVTKIQKSKLNETAATDVAAKLGHKISELLRDIMSVAKVNNTRDAALILSDVLKHVYFW
jgi:hypothetical protein